MRLTRQVLSYILNVRQMPKQHPPGLRRIGCACGGTGDREMQVLIRAYDGENKLEKRMAVRARHLENMAKVNGRVICAGGLLDENGKMKGSALILEFAGREQLEAYLASEPYVLEHVWETIEVEPMNVVILNGERAGA